MKLVSESFLEDLKALMYQILLESFINYDQEIQKRRRKR